MPIFDDSVWQMSYGERAALEGVLCELDPVLAIEIGTAEGGSLARIAAHADEVHSFDLVTPRLAVEEIGNVTIHTGDSHDLLPKVLQAFTDAARNVDFVLVDGDHSSEGVKRDLEDLLNSPAISNTVILIHDINNEQVRAGVDAVHYAAFPKVAHADLDFVPGYMFSEERLRHELWGGLGLVIVDAKRVGYFSGSVMQQRYYPAAALFAEIRDRVVARETAAREQERIELEHPLGHPELHAQIARLESDNVALKAEVNSLTAAAAHHEHLWRSLMDSISWKITAPLRLAIRIARRALS